MTKTLLSERARVIAVLLAALVVGALAVAVGPRSGGFHAGAAATGTVTMEMKVTGTKSGVFKGDSLQRGHEDFIVLSAYHFEISSPRDPATGLATGHRQMKPVQVTKMMNASSPQVLNACATNENLKTVIINFWRTDRTGVPVNFYRVTLTNANIADVTQHSSGMTVTEDVSFTFQKIQQEDLVAHTMWEDSWTGAIS